MAIFWSEVTYFIYGVPMDLFITEFDYRKSNKELHVRYIKEITKEQEHLAIKTKVSLGTLKC